MTTRNRFMVQSFLCPNAISQNWSNLKSLVCKTNLTKADINLFC